MLNEIYIIPLRRSKQIGMNSSNVQEPGTLKKVQGYGIRKSSKGPREILLLFFRDLDKGLIQGLDVIGGI